MGKTLRALIIEDSEDDTMLLIRELKGGGYEPVFERVDTSPTLITALEREGWDIIFADYTMPRFSGTDALAIIKERRLDIPFIFVTGTMGEDKAVAAIKSGAQDYIIKGNYIRLLPTVERELREAEARREKRLADETIRYLAYYDSLTGLPNRASLQENLKKAIGARKNKNERVALFIMDLDHFKDINDTLGHQRGDLLLQKVGSLLRRLLWEPDVVSRLGGDEFAILLPKLAAVDDINIVIQKVVKGLEVPVIIDGFPINVEASIGVALHPDHGEDAEALFQHADIAMYNAKRIGASYSLYDPEQDQYNPRKLALMGELRQAIEDDRLSLHYQPKIRLKDRRITGVEALVRWEHPTHGFIPPDEFIGPAEKSGLIRPLAEWVLGAAMNRVRIWQQEGLKISVSVNLSVRNIQDDYLLKVIAELLEITGLEAANLELELTESAIMSDPARALDVLNHLKNMNIKISIDDFGTGYSSLGYLKKLPVDSVKIDKSFVINMARVQEDAVIVRSIIDLAHNLGLTVVAEGVENKETWDQLVTLNCDEAQGFYMSRPLPADQLTTWVANPGWGLDETGSAGES